MRLHESRLTDISVRLDHTCENFVFGALSPLPFVEKFSDTSPGSASLLPVSPCLRVAITAQENLLENDKKSLKRHVD